ncbi:MAG: glycosyltransferase family 39 protein [Thermoanaerobaculum sp.]
MKREHRLLILLCLVACLVSAAAGWNNSATNDEPYFTLGAYAAFEGKGIFVVEHPPLYKLFAGLSLHFLPLRSSDEGRGAAFHDLPTTIHRFLHRNTVPGLHILRVARLGMLAFLPLLLWGVFRLGELVGGPKVGLAAALALACQPLVLGHAFVVHTDVPAAACWVWVVVMVERALSGVPWAWMGTGLWLGLALAAKHSAVLLILLLAVRLLVARLRGQAIPWRWLAGAFLGSWLLVLALTSWTLRHVSVGEEQELVRLVSEKLSPWSWVSPVFLPLAALCKACCHWFLGLAFVVWNSTHGQGVNFFWGQLSPYGFALYFPVALLIKLSLPFTALWVAAVVSWRTLPRLARWLGVYVALYLLASLGSAFNIGARHLMPAVAFLAVPAGWGLLRLGKPLRLAAIAALVAAPVVVFPHYIAHFSMLAGGARGGERILNDSNLDWGQDWARVAMLARERGWRPLFAVYLGPDDASAYGTPVENLLLTGRFPEHGFVAVSSWAAAVGPAYFEYFGLRENARFLRSLLGVVSLCPKVGEVGHTIRIYRCGAATQGPQGTPGLSPNPRE